MSSRWTSAAQGASAGATVGGTVGPYGTVGGALVGGIAGAITSGETDAQRLERERLEDLMRRQELGTLGLTDQEINVSLNKEQGALSQQQQAQAAQQAGLLATTGVGAGAYFKGQQEADSRQRQEMAMARQKVEARDVMEKRAQEAEIQTLAGLAETREALERKAMVTALTDVSGQVIGAGTDLNKLTEAKKMQAAMETKEFNAWEGRLSEAFGGQGQASVSSQLSMYDNVQPQLARARFGAGADTGFNASQGFASTGLSNRLAMNQFNTLGMGGNLSYGESPFSAMTNQDFQALMREDERKRFLASLGAL